MIDINKKYRTRDGREVRIYATDGGSPCSVIGVVRSTVGWEMFQWFSDGSSTLTDERPLDLIEVKEEKQG